MAKKGHNIETAAPILGPKTDEEVAVAMTRLHVKKNCNEEGDLTREARWGFWEAPAVQCLAKVSDQTFPNLVTDIERHVRTDRDHSKIYYEDRSIVMSAVLTFVSGQGSISGASMLDTPVGVENLKHFAKQDVERFPDYQTMTDAMAKINNFDGFNEVFASQYDELIRSRRYESTTPTVVFRGMRKDDGTFGLEVARATPAIMDGVETYRSQQRQSNMDLTFVKKDDKGNISRIDFAHKFQLIIARMNENFSIPLCARAIENPPGLSRPEDMVNQGTEKEKQRCETSVATEMIDWMRDRWPLRKFLYQGDGLYATSVFIQKIAESRNPFCFTLKEGCAPSLYNDVMAEAERQREEYKEGKRDQDPVRHIRYNGTDMWVQIIRDAGGLTGSTLWKDLPIDVVIARYYEHILIKDDGQGKRLYSKSEKEEARNKNKDLPDYTQKECESFLREYYRTKRSDIACEEIDEILKSVEFIQRRDPATGYRIVEAKVNRRFVWATNIVVDLEAEPEAKKLLTGYLLESYKAQKKAGEWYKENSYINGFIGQFVRIARGRWTVEEVFNLLKTGTMKIEQRKARKSYKAEKAYFYIALLAWMLLGAYRIYDKMAAKGWGGKWKIIAYDFMCSFRNDRISNGTDYLERKTCLRVQLKA